MSNPTDSNTMPKPIALTVIGAVASIGMLAMPLIAGAPNGEAMPALAHRHSLTRATDGICLDFS
jgi:hypothetical protein